MDTDRTHFRTTSTGSSAAASSELFICFTSRLSSPSSMKISKSIVSPGRTTRDVGPVTLSSSLSRRLRTNGSLKAGQSSPFFNTAGKKRGGAFENPEPSSPKVTCIGQVRVKTKKKVKQSRSLSRRGSGGGGEVSFRKIEQKSCVDRGDNACGQQQQQRYSDASAHFQAPPQQECSPHRNQKWVHLPISICEALRTFGAEFSCLFPCRSASSSTGESEGEKSAKLDGNENGCGAVFARWLVSANDGEGGKMREIELVVGGGDEEDEAQEEAERVSTRRHVFDDIEVKGNRIELKGQCLEREEEAARVSICVPPKNALLLMRCRSDPVKMAALAKNQLNGTAGPSSSASASNVNEDIEEEEEGLEENMVGGKDKLFHQEVAVSEDNNDKQEITNEVEDRLEIEGDKEGVEEEELENSSEEMFEEKTELEILVLEGPQEALVEEEEGGGGGEEEEEEVEPNISSLEGLLDRENAEDDYEDCCPIQDEEDAHTRHLSPSTVSDEEVSPGNEPPPLLQESSATIYKAEADLSSEQKDSVFESNGERSQATSPPTAKTDYEDAEEEEKVETEAKSEKNNRTQESITSNEKKEKEAGLLLPECLLLMMREPKLSMEVSKETWVCSTDFTKWLPERPRKAAKPGDHDPVKRRLSIDSKPKPINGIQQPPRSSCSLPAAAATASMATMVNAVAYEPFVLSRCKSEPMRTAAAKLMPESCFWKNGVRKLEPHTMGVGAAGVGF